MAQSLTLVFLCLAVGAWARRSGRLPPQTPHVLNRLVLDVALPALVLKALHPLVLTTTLFWASSMLWLVMAGSFVLFFLLGRRRLGDKTAAALALTAGLCNTAFLGVPLIEGFYGQAGVGPAVVVDQMGSFLLLSTVALALAAFASGRSLEPGAVLAKVALFPPFLALVLALTTHPLTYPAWLEGTLGRLGELVTPLSLLSVGYQLRFSALRGRVRLVGAGLFYKLALAPLLVALIFHALGGRGMVFKVTVLQAAMAPMISAGIVATEYGLDATMADLMIGVGIPVSILTVPILKGLLG
jgi:predicted permease